MTGNYARRYGIEPKEVNYMVTFTERYEELWIRFIREKYRNRTITQEQAFKLAKEFEKWLFKLYPDGGIAG